MATVAPEANEASDFGIRKVRTLTEFCERLPMLSISSKARLVWLVIHQSQLPRADEYENGAKLSYADIVEKTGLCEKSVRNAVKELIETRLLRVLRKGRVVEFADGEKRNVKTIYRTQKATKWAAKKA